MVTHVRAQARNPWIRRIILAALFLVVAYLVLLVLLSRFLDPEALATRLEPRLEAAVAREVEIGTATVSFLPLGMRLTDITVADPTGLSPQLALVPAVEFQVALLPLFRREVQVRRLVVESPAAFLTVGPDGQTNFGNFSPTLPQVPEQAPGPERGEGGLELPFQLALDEVRVNYGAIVYSDPSESTEVSVGDLSVRASIQQGPLSEWDFRGTINSDIALRTPGSNGELSGIPVSFSFDAGSDSEFRTLEIRQGDLGVEGAFLEVSGTVQNLKEPVRALSLTLAGQGIPIRRLAEALPDSVRPGGMEADGTLNVDLRVAGNWGNGAKPEVSGTLEMNDASLRSRQGTRLARDLSADLLLNADRTLQVDARGEVMDGPFSMDGRVQLGGERPVDLQLDAYPDLGLIPSVVQLPEGSSLEGRVKVEGRITGPVGQVRNLRFWGDLSPADIGVTTPKLGVPVRIPGGHIAFQGNLASFRDLPIILGDDSLGVSGEASNLSGFGAPGRTVGLRASVRGPRLNLLEVSPNPPPDPALTYGKVAFAHLSNRQVAGGSPEEGAQNLRLNRPDSLPVAGELMVSLDTLVDARGRTLDVQANASFGPRFLRVSQSNFRRYGGQLSASLNLSLGQEDTEPFSLQLSLDGLDARNFLSSTSPLGEYVRGSLSMSLELAGSLDSLFLPDPRSLMGSGSFQLVDGEIGNNSVTEALADFLGMDEFRAPGFRDWSTGFILENGRVRLAEATLTQAPGDPRLGGTIGLDGELDLLSAFTLPSDRLGRFARENLGIAGEVAGRVANRPEVVQAVVRIGGSILYPDLRADPQATAEALSNALQEEFTTEAQNRIRAQRQTLQEQATGFLRNLTQRREAPPPPAGTGMVPDTLAGDTISPDSLRPDTIPSDSLRPDTTALEPPEPDTIRPDTTAFPRLTE